MDKFAGIPAEEGFTGSKEVPRITTVHTAYPDPCPAPSYPGHHNKDWDTKPLPNLGWEDEPNFMNEKLPIHDLILSCIYITNVNLINLSRRLEAKSHNTTRYTSLYQSEALSIFKGNFIRLIKTMYDSSTINRLKRILTFDLKLDTVHPVVNSVEIIVPNYLPYMPSETEATYNKLCKAFRDLDDREVQEKAWVSMKENEVKRSITEFSQISLDHIKNIKF